MSTIVNSSRTQSIAQIALPVPLRNTFDYQVPDEFKHRLKPGVRIVVTLGRRRLIGLVIDIKSNSAVPANKIKPVLSVIDDQPIVSPPLFKLLLWVADYYQQPLGEVIKAALPSVYDSKNTDWIKTYQLTDSLSVCEIEDSLVRAPKQKKIVRFMMEHNQPVTQGQLKAISNGWRGVINSLIKKQIVIESLNQQPWPAQKNSTKSKGPKLSSAQLTVIKQLSAHINTFKVSLLKGVTGSGKTEVYLELGQRLLDTGKQILVLVPEIALTPQLVSRFEQRLGLKAALIHSSLTEKQRRASWRAAANNQAKVILGTRSAVFTSIPDLGLIILDEEHDMSYKQTEGVRYHARDVAIMRAKLEGIPIIMGSATPSLESLANVIRGRYQLCELTQRVAGAMLPEIHLLNLDQLQVRQGLSITLINAIERNLKQNQQTLIFINRRGYAPVVMCKHCGEIASCRRCHARLTYHQDGSLQCHHCGVSQIADDVCSNCQSSALIRLGQGTQRIEHTLNNLFPGARISRLDRDATRKKDELEAVLETMANRQIDILVGTQMLSKGHDFPAVTLVGILNADQGLFGLDYHATESMIQQLLQVSGRAGRARKPGKVLIQTHFPKHPLYDYITRHDYAGFAAQELKLRTKAGFPPYHYLALIRASSKNEKAALNFLINIKRMAKGLLNEFPMVKIMDPVHSPMAKRQDLYRAQLLLSSQSRSARQVFLKNWLSLFERSPLTKYIRWSVDVDPLDLF